MAFWAQLVLVLCAVAVTLVLVPALLALRRASERAERVLAQAEREFGPLAGQLQHLIDDLRALSQDVRGEVARVGALAARAEEVSRGIGRVLSAVAGLTRAGQLVGVAAGLKTGLDVFLNRLRRQQGDDHG
jgi:uncharacterized protein YoxC